MHACMHCIVLRGATTVLSRCFFRSNFQVIYYKSFAESTSKRYGVSGFCWSSVRLVLSLGTPKLFTRLSSLRYLWIIFVFLHSSTPFLSPSCHYHSVSLSILLSFWRGISSTSPIRRDHRSASFLVSLDKSRFVQSKDPGFALRTLILES